jgi:hypothetical protein
VTRALFACWLLVMTSGALAVAQAPNFAGTWKLDRAKSTIVDSAGLAGLAPKGAPDVLHITQPANGTVVIESQINEGHMRLYRPGNKTSSPAGGGAVEVNSKWDARALVSEGTRADSGGAAVAIREVMTLTSDGTLKIEVTATEAAGKTVSTLIYAKVQSVGPCESWPTPCKRP